MDYSDEEKAKNKNGLYSSNISSSENSKTKEKDDEDKGTIYVPISFDNISFKDI